MQMLKFAEPVTIEPQVEIIPANYFAPLDFGAIYGRAASCLEVDLGCGDGSFLMAAATASPQRNFLGIERLAGRVRSACHKITASGVTNARVLRCELFYAVQHLLPAGSVTVFHLLFPDPWPKRRHASRRILTESFLESLHRGLASRGTIRIATDQLEYFRQIEHVAAASSQFEAVSEDQASGAMSTFERQFRRDAIEIHRLVLRKISEVA
jgi:tRNA (guanine-N7-)-methyltransferase